MVGHVDDVVPVFELEAERERREVGGSRRLRALEALQSVCCRDRLVVAGRERCHAACAAARTGHRGPSAIACARAPASSRPGPAVHVAEVADFGAAAHPKRAAASGLLHRVDQRLHAYTEPRNCSYLRVCRKLRVQYTNRIKSQVAEYSRVAVPST